MFEIGYTQLSNLSETPQVLEAPNGVSDQYSRERTAMANSPILPPSSNSDNYDDPNQRHRDARLIAYAQIAQWRDFIIDAYDEMITVMGTYLTEHREAGDAEDFGEAVERIAPELKVMFRLMSALNVDYAGALEQMAEHTNEWANYMEKIAEAIYTGNLDGLSPEAYKLALQQMDYPDYLQTKHWQGVRKAALERALNRCQVCNTDTKVLHVHHRTYENRGNEQPEDVIVLCSSCHSLFHKNGKLTK